jgi:hypothetical protein
MRGRRHERWPLLVLKENERRLEVAVTTGGNICERLGSKALLPLRKWVHYTHTLYSHTILIHYTHYTLCASSHYRWVHVAVVSEGPKLRLFLNGLPDAQRANSAPPRTNRHPFYVGKVPEEARLPDTIRGGLEGSIAQLRYHTRAQYIMPYTDYYYTDYTHYTHYTPHTLQVPYQGAIAHPRAHSVRPRPALHGVGAGDGQASIPTHLPPPAHRAVGIGG